MSWSRRMLWIPRDGGLCIVACFEETRCVWRCYFIKGLRWICFPTLKSPTAADDCDSQGKRKKTCESHWACSLDTATAWDVWASVSLNVFLRGEPPQPANGRRETLDHTSRAGGVLRPRWGQLQSFPDVTQNSVAHVALWYTYTSLIVVNCR